MAKRKAGTRTKSSRELLMTAALEEFSSHGFSGARIDRITENAGVNVRMIYHHFGNKRGLLEAVLSEIFQQRQSQMSQLPERLDELLCVFFEGYATDQHRVRLLEWEALETSWGALGDKPELTDMEDRKNAIASRVEVIRRLQDRGEAPKEIPADMLYLLLVALSIYPMSFPQSVYVATGEDAYSKKFRKRYKEVLETLARLIRAGARVEQNSEEAPKED